MVARVVAVRARLVDAILLLNVMHCVLRSCYYSCCSFYSMLFSLYGSLMPSYGALDGALGKAPFAWSCAYVCVCIYIYIYMYTYTHISYANSLS